MIVYVAAIAIPYGKVKVVIWALACTVILATASDLLSPVNPMWLLAVLAFGYAIYRIEWKTRLDLAPKGSDAPDSQLTERVEGIEAVDDEVPLKLRSVATFLVVNAFLVAAILLTYGMGGPSHWAIPSAYLATAYLGAAAIGAGMVFLFLYMRAALQVARDYAAVTFATALVVASAIHILSTPEVTSWVWGESAGAQLWKPILVAYSSAAALGIILTTLSGRFTQVRPIMAALILPAAMLLPVESFFSLERDQSLYSWFQRFLEAGITMAVLWLMWYGFGPGRRKASKPAV